MNWHQRQNQEGKTNLDLLEQETVSGSGSSNSIVTVVPPDPSVHFYHSASNLTG